MLQHLIGIERYSYNLCGRIALDQKIINYQQLLEALQEQHFSPKKKIGTILQELNYVNTRTWLQLLEFQTKFLQKSCISWPYLPNTVIKGALSAGIKIGKLNWEQVADLESDKLQILQDRLLDLKLLTQKDIKAFLHYLKSITYICSKCCRRYELFHYAEQENVINCPICWEHQLEIQPILISDITTDMVSKTIISANKEPRTQKSQKIITIDLPELACDVDDVMEEQKFTKAKASSVEKIIFSQKGQKGQKDYQKIYFTVLFFCILIFISCSTFFYYAILLPQQSENQNSEPMIVKFFPKDKEKKVNDKPVLLLKKNKKEIFSRIVKSFFSKNISLAKIRQFAIKLDYWHKKNGEYLADYYNLQGRVLFYLVWIDDKQQIKNGKKILEESIEYLEKSIDIYEKKTILFLHVMPWMPEAKIYKVKPWMKKFPVIQFNSVEDVKSNTRDLIQQILAFQRRYYNEKNR